MSITLFFPPVSHVARIDDPGRMTLEDLCRRAGVACRASGPWTRRMVVICRGPGHAIEAEPGSRGCVRVTVPAGLDDLAAARHALAAMAYAVFDLVARQSIRGAAWAAIGGPVGRPPKIRPLSGAERQRRHRERLRAKAAAAPAGPHEQGGA